MAGTFATELFEKLSFVSFVSFVVKLYLASLAVRLCIAAF